MTGVSVRGCSGLFTPAVPEAPTGRPIVADYRSPEATLSTMENAIAAKALGASAWLGAFADSTLPEDTPAYHQIFDAADLAYFQSACSCEGPSDWRYGQEQVFFSDFLDVRPGDEYVVQFAPWDDYPDEPPSPTTAVLHRSYVVLATAPDGNSRLVIAVGFVDLTFTNKGGKWLITRWVDHIDPAYGVNPTDPYTLTFGRRRLESTQ